MIIYKKLKTSSQHAFSPDQWYARPVINETYDLDRLSQHMADHNTPFSVGVIRGVLADMLACIKELVLDGKSVKLDDLAIFSIGLRCKMAPTAEEFKPATHIVGLRLRSRSTGNLSTQAVNLEATLKELTEYSKPTTDPTV